MYQSKLFLVSICPVKDYPVKNFQVKNCPVKKSPSKKLSQRGIENKILLGGWCETCSAINVNWSRLHQGTGPSLETAPSGWLSIKKNKSKLKSKKKIK